jgi:hypothetical protein
MFYKLFNCRILKCCKSNQRDINGGENVVNAQLMTDC